MTKTLKFILASCILLTMSSFAAHKFYVAIYQIDFVPEKKRVEITARIFLDDLNVALEKEFKVKTNLGEKSESSQDLVFLQKYFTSHLKVSIDGKEKTVFYLSKEIENNVAIIYLKIPEIKKFSSFKIHNNALLDVYGEQQNIIQTDFYDKKRNYIFSGDYFTENIIIK